VIGHISTNTFFAVRFDKNTQDVEIGQTCVLTLLFGIYERFFLRAGIMYTAYENNSNTRNWDLGSINLSQGTMWQPMYKHIYATVSPHENRVFGARVDPTQSETDVRKLHEENRLLKYHIEHRKYQHEVNIEFYQKHFRKKDREICQLNEEIQNLKSQLAELQKKCDGKNLYISDLLESVPMGRQLKHR